MAFGTQDDTDEVMNEINMTPMVDIMLVLLIIFIITIPVMKDSLNAEGKPKNLNPNVDFFSASAYYTMGIPLDLFTPIFAIARVAGWTAHVMEQHHNNRIIRPTDDYTGPFDKKVVSVEKR